MIHTAAQPSHDWAASEPQTDFTVNANGTSNLLEATRRHAPAADVHLLLHQQGLRRSAQPPAPGRARCKARAAGEPPLLRRDRHVDVDRRLDPLAVRRLQGGGRPARPGVRALLRHADRLLPRWLPDRPQPRRREAPRLPLLPDALHDDRRAVHGVRLRRQAGAGQHPLRRPGRGVRSVPPRPAARRHLQHRWRAREQLLDARSDRHVPGDRRSRAHLGAARTRAGSAITAGGSPIWSRSATTTRTGTSPTTSRTSCARSTSRTPSCGSPPDEAVGRDPGSQRGRTRSARPSRAR